MITYLSPFIPAKVKRSEKKFTSILQEINDLSGRHYRLYFDAEYGILVDITKNKILWIADANFSMAIFEVRLNYILKYWRNEKTIDKSNIVYLDYIRCRQNFKALYIYD